MKNVFGLICFLLTSFCFAQNEPAKKVNPADGEELEFVQVYSAVEVSAQPQGGMDAFRKYLATSFNLPEVSQTTIATVIVKFVVWNDGMVKNIQIIKETPENLGLGNEAIRILSKSAKWTPAIQNGRNVCQYFTLPLKFEIPGSGKIQNPSEELKKKDVQVVAAKDSIDVSPEPIEGLQKFYTNVQKSIKVPSNEVPGTYKTKVSFMVDLDGTLTDFKIISNSSPIAITLGEETIRVLKTFPKWKPGSKKTQFVLPVTVVVEEEAISKPKKE